MSRERDDCVFLRHMLEELAFLEKVRRDVSLQNFMASEVLQRAVVRSLEILGEAVKNLSESTMKADPTIPWRSIAGMRDKLIHSYFGVDYVLVWNVVEHHAPTLLKKIENLVGRLCGGSSEANRRDMS